jgi:phosphatidylserine decarboxylase
MLAGMSQPAAADQSRPPDRPGQPPDAPAAPAATPGSREAATGSAAPDAPPGPVRIGPRAARVLVAELLRRPAPVPALLVGAAPGSAVLAAAIDALPPGDPLTVLATDPAPLRSHLAGRGLADRVRVVDSTAGVPPVDVIVLAEPVTGEAEPARAALAELAKLLNPGGVIAAAVIAVPGLAGGAAAELDRQAMLFGVGSDLILRNLPPVRVHRLGWSPPDLALADRLHPVDRPSSVPLTRELHLDSNGVAAAGIALGLAALTRLAGSRLWWLPAVAAVPLAGFFRDPQRVAPPDPALVLAASDGVVLAVERVSDDRFSDGGGEVDYLRVAVFLSVLDVHVNRAPVAGRVVDHFLTDGGYAPAMTPAGEHNVAAYTVLATARGRVVVAQRTGLLARRIVHRAPVGSTLARGERFGLIRFGSRTDVYLPAGAVEVLVAAGDRVHGGSTPLARWR